MSQFMKFSARRRTPAHRSVASPRARFATIGGILTSTAIIGGGAFFGLSSVDGTYALFNGSASVTAGTLNSGSMIVRVGDSSAGPNPSTPYVINTSALPVMFPGDFQQGTYYVDAVNTPSTLTSDIFVRTTALVPAGFEVNIKSGACSGALSGYVISTSDVLLGTWGSNSTLPICVQLSVPLSAPSSTQGASSGKIEFIITAKQKP